jgi:hypothetical protein
MVAAPYEQMLDQIGFALAAPHLRMLFQLEGVTDERLQCGSQARCALPSGIGQLSSCLRSFPTLAVVSCNIKAAPHRHLVSSAQLQCADISHPAENVR